MRTARGGGGPWLDRRTLLAVVVSVSGVVGALLCEIAAPYIQGLTGLTGPRLVYPLAGFVFCSLVGLLGTWLLAVMEARREQTGTTPAPTSHTLRPPVADLTGRDAEIDELVGHLADESIAGPVVVIRGMGGVGKTELALAVAHRLAPRCPDAQLWFELQPGGKATSEEELVAAVLRAIRPEVQLPNTLNELLSVYRATLAGKQGLLLLDNATDAAQVQHLLPPPAGWMALVTSRHRFGLDGACLCDLGALSGEQAQSFLRTVFSAGEREVADEQVATLAELCGRLPLALRLAGEYLTTCDTEPIDGYLMKLRASRLRQLTSENRSVVATLALSIARLGREDRRRASRWRQLAVFPAPFDLQAAAAVWEITDEGAQEALNILRARSLVQHAEGSAPYDLHDLLRDYARQPIGIMRHVPAHSNALMWRYANHYLCRAEAVSVMWTLKSGYSARGLDEFNAIWPHLKAAWAWVLRRRGWLESRRARLWHRRFAVEAQALLILCLRPKESALFHQLALDWARHVGDKAAEGPLVFNLGMAQLRLGEAQRAVRCFETAWDILRDDDAGGAEAVIRHVLGLAYIRLGRPRLAAVRQRQALALSRQLGDHHVEGMALAGLAGACIELGEIQQAIEYSGQAVAILREVGDRRQEGLALHLLGIAYLAQGKAQQATECIEQLLAIAQETCEGYLEAVAWGGLGLAYTIQRELQRAEECLEQSVAASREVGSRDQEASALIVLGRVYVELGSARRGIECCEEALTVARAISSMPLESAALTVLGRAYAVLGWLSTAIDHYERSLSIEQLLGYRNAATMTGWRLGLAYEEMARFDEAADLMQLRVDYEREIGHLDAECHACYLEEVRLKAAGDVPADGGADVEEGE